jgi:1,2-phenylacetyl-CoA epoxidase PaaB subunit
MARWPVLQQRREGSDWELVGYVHAPDREMALGFALHSFFRHGEGVNCAIRDGDEVVTVTDPRDVVAHTDKSYRVSAGYPLGPKRRRAERRIAELGVRIDAPRPGVDNRRDRSSDADGGREVVEA